jgi:hypothetical protein
MQYPDTVLTGAIPKGAKTGKKEKAKL